MVSWFVAGVSLRAGKSDLVPAFGRLARTLVLEGDQTFRKGFVFQQGEVALREATGKQRKAFAEQHRHNAEIEFVHQVCLEEIARQFASAHEPDVLTFAFAKLADQRFRRLAGKYAATAFPRRQRA